MNLFGIVPANPAMLAGLFMVSAPLFIHLLTRRTPVDILFPTLQFLQRAKASQSRLFRLRHLLLLLLRTVVIALVLAAFLRPIYQASALAAGNDEQAENAAVVILDASLSMTYTGGGVTPLSRSIVAAQKIVGHLGAADLANVIVASATPKSSFEKPENNRHQLRRDLESVTSTLEYADIDAAIALAVNQLDELKGYRKEIHFVSDFQRSNWAAVNYGVIPEDVRVVFIAVGDEDAANAAITEAAVKPPQPAASEPVQVICKVANYGPLERKIPLELVFNDATSFKRSLSIQPGMTVSATFRLRPNTPGIFEGILRIPRDGLEADDTRFFSLPVTDRVHVAILSDERDNPKGARRFLEMAVKPFGGDSGMLVPASMRPAAFDSFVAARSQAVIVADVEVFSEETAKALVQYLRGGGGVIYFLGGHADKANLTLLEKVAEKDLVPPFRLGRLVEPGDRPDRFAVLHEANYDTPLLKKFRDTAALAELHFFRYFMTERQSGQGQVLMRYDDGHIALAKKSVVLGSLLLANFTPALDGSDMARHTVFLPLIHEMIRDVRPQDVGTHLFTVGRPASTTVTLASADSPIRFTAPGGEEIGAAIEIRGHEEAVVFTETDAAGFYRVYEEETRVGSVAVNIDSRESNLDILTVDQLRDLSKISRERFFAEAGEDADALRRLRAGTPLWHYFLLASMILLVLEQFIAMIWKR